MKKQLLRSVLTLVMSTLILTGAIPAYAQKQNATVQYVELWRLSKGEAGIVLEFGAGLEPNKSKLSATGKYHNGAEIFRYVDKGKEDLMLFFETRSDGNRLFSGMAAKTGNFLGIQIGTDSIEAIVDFLGASDVFEETTDMTDLPMAAYYFPDGTLRLHANKKHVITEADYKVEDNTKRLAIRDALTPGVYKSAEPLNIPLLRELSSTGIIPPQAWYDFKWPVSRDRMAYICVSLYEFLTKDELEEANPSPYADAVNSYALKAVTLGIFDDLSGETGILKPNVKPNNEEVCNMLNITLKAANIDYAVVSLLDPKDRVSYEDALVMVYNALKSEAVHKNAITKTVKIYCPNNDSSKLVSVTKDIKMSPSLFLESRNTFKAIEAALKQTGGEASRNVLEKDTVINGVSLDKEAGLLRLDISGDILTYNVGTGAEGLMLSSLALTFMEFYDADQLMLTVDGRLYESGHGIIEPGETFIRENIKKANSPEKQFYDLQQSVDNGHQPWRLNPEEVALEFATRTLNFKGTAALSWRNEKESARVNFTKQSGEEIHIDLYQPAVKGLGGIWEVECWFDENSRLYQIRELTALPPLFYNDDNVPQNIKEWVRNVVVKDWTETFSVYYNVLGFYAENVSYTVENNTAELKFIMTLVTQNFYKDSDTVGYIKEAKEKGSARYQQLYDEYNMPRSGNVDLKVTMSLDAYGKVLPDTVQVFNNISFNDEEEYVPAKAADFIIKE